MELEFDKEIDAILRRSRETRGALGGDNPPSKHLDADIIAAFAENALPEKTKLLNMKHFADCDRCRKQLSQTITMNAEATSTSVVSAPVADTAIPWYQSLFKAPSIAPAMGALVLAFSGVLGYFILQNYNDSKNATVTQVAEQEPPRGGPYFGGDAGMAANLNALSVMANTANVSNKMAASPESRANAAANSAAKENATANTVSVDRSDRNFALDGVMAEAAKPVAASPTNTVESKDDFDEQKSDTKKLKQVKDLELLKRDQTELRGRDAQPPAAKMSPMHSGPRQNQLNQANNSVFDMAVSRTVGGKTFDSRNGVWYDSAYRGQATVNHRRGTDEYEKLDKGLRNIADTLGGTIVVVWKEKAYRIQ